MEWEGQPSTCGTTITMMSDELEDAEICDNKLKLALTSAADEVLTTHGSPKSYLLSLYSDPGKAAAFITWILHKLPMRPTKKTQK